MGNDTAFSMTHFSATGMPVIIDPDLCIACNECVEVCRAHVILPNLENSKPPMIVYQEECWYCGCCAANCPSGALTLRYPISRRVGWKRKETNEYYRIGMKNPPSPNNRPPVCP